MASPNTAAIPTAAIADTNTNTPVFLLPDEVVSSLTNASSSFKPILVVNFLEIGAPQELFFRAQEIRS